MLHSILMVAALSLAVVSDVIDNAGIFSDETKKAVVSELRAHEEKTGVETLIESFSEAETKTFRNESEKAVFFKAWLRRAAEARNAHGVFVLICKSPGRMQVDFHKALIDGNQNQAAMDSIRDAGLPLLKAKDADGALSAIAKQVVQLVDHRADKPRTAGFSPIVAAQLPDWLPWLILGVVVVVVGLCIAASFTASGATHERYPSGNYAGSGRRSNGGGGSPTVIHTHSGGGGIDPLMAGVVGYQLGANSHHSSPPPSYDSPPSYSSGHHDSGSSGFSFDSGGGGGDFSGGSGGDF